jgi:hypothetical protein
VEGVEGTAGPVVGRHLASPIVIAVTIFGGGFEFLLFYAFVLELLEFGQVGFAVIGETALFEGEVGEVPLILG